MIFGKFMKSIDKIFNYNYNVNIFFYVFKFYILFFIPWCRKLHIKKLICSLLQFALTFVRLVAYAVSQNNIYNL